MNKDFKSPRELSRELFELKKSSPITNEDLKYLEGEYWKVPDSERRANPEYAEVFGEILAFVSSTRKSDLDDFFWA